MRITLLGSGGWAATDERETACTLIEDASDVLLLDAGSGARRLITDDVVDHVERVDVVLTHFHLDHVVGLGYIQSVADQVVVWAPGAWLYRRPSAAILDPLLRPPFLAHDLRDAYRIEELQPDYQTIGRFDVVAGHQPNHWAPSVGIRVADRLALITDTPYEPSSSALAQGVKHLLHEAWSTSAAPLYAHRDATAADGARVALEARAERLTLIHLNPRNADQQEVLDDARAIFSETGLGHDLLVLE